MTIPTRYDHKTLWRILKASKRFAVSKLITDLPTRDSMTKFFSEIEDDIYAETELTPQSEEDGRQWIADCERILGRGKPCGLILDPRRDPGAEAERGIAIWYRNRFEQLRTLVRLAVYVAESGHQELQTSIRARQSSSPYPLALASSRTEAITLARRAVRAA